MFRSRCVVDSCLSSEVSEFNFYSKIMLKVYLKHFGPRLAGGNMWGEMLAIRTVKLPLSVIGGM